MIIFFIYLVVFILLFDMKIFMNKLSIIVPCYNEEKTILSVIDEINEYSELEKK